jgi:hypothetical protein
MAQKETPRSSFTRTPGVAGVTCTACGLVTGSAIAGNLHFVQCHPEKLCPTTKQQTAKTSPVSKTKASAAAVKTAKAAAVSSARAA